MATDYNWDFIEEGGEKAIDHNLKILEELYHIIYDKGPIEYVQHTGIQSILKRRLSGGGNILRKHLGFDKFYEA